MPDYTEMPMQARGLVLTTLFRDAADVKRYHTQRTIRQQTIGAHSFNMLLILDQVAPDARKAVWQAVVHHDMPELFTGDMPAPIKRLHPELKVMMQEAETDLEPLYRDLGLTAPEEGLIKFCDTLELVLWCLEEWRMGNRYVRACILNGLTWLWQGPTHVDDNTLRCTYLLRAVSQDAHKLGAIAEEELPLNAFGATE